jgi:hypothetical protein
MSFILPSIDAPENVNLFYDSAGPDGTLPILTFGEAASSFYSSYLLLAVVDELLFVETVELPPFLESFVFFDN